MDFLRVSSFTNSVLSMAWKIIAFVFLGLFLASHWLVDWFIFPRPKASYDGGHHYFGVQTEKGVTIACRYLEHPRARQLIIHSHGNGEDLGLIEPFLQGLQRAGFHVLAYDYPGYGLSEGRPSEQGTYDALEAVVQFASEELGFSQSDVILHGRSLGAGPSIEIALGGEFGGLILESAFTSVFKLGVGIGWIPWDRFQNLSKVPELRVPTLVLHGVEDKIVPFSHGEQLFEAVEAPKLFFWVDAAGHHDMVVQMGDQYWAVIQDFARLLRT